MMFTLKKIALFPISLFVAFLALMAKWLLTLSSYVVAPLMLYIFGCGIYTAYRQSMLKKIVLFPISLFVAFLAMMAKWLLTLSSYVVAPLMLYIFGCGIYTAYRQTWDQFLILLVAEFICFILFFGATAITEGIGRFSEWLAEL